MTGEATYTATFTETANKYTIKFVNEDGTELQSSEVAYGETPVYTGETPTKAADAQYTYTFAGWSPEIVSVTGEAIYTAQYELIPVKTYTVTFVDWDGTVLKTETVEEGKSATAPADPTREGYTFTGWDKAFDNVTSDLTVTATYENIPLYRITVRASAGGQVSTSAIMAAKGESVTVTATPFEGYTLKSITIAGIDVTAQVDGNNQHTFTMPAESVEIVVVFEEIPATTYTVTFVDWDGTVLKTETVEEGKAATAPDAPTREGYNFTGWDVAFDSVTSDLTVTAQYELIPVKTYTVTFVDWDGTVLKTETVEEGKAATAPADPTREGYTFTGWDVEFSSVTSDLTVTAQYELTPVVDPDPVIISPTKDQIVTVYEGEQATMSIVAENAVFYQWMLSDDGGRNWYKRGENSSTYVSSPTKLENDGYIYKCIVTGKNGKTVEGHIFTLEVLEKIDLPETGDNSQIGLWMTMCFISFAGILVFSLGGKKRKIE